jgi:hypothetical protein
MLKRGAEISGNIGCSSSGIVFVGPSGGDVGQIGDDKAEGQVAYLCGSLSEAYLQLHEEIVPLQYIVRSNGKNRVENPSKFLMLVQHPRNEATVSAI